MSCSEDKIDELLELKDELETLVELVYQFGELLILSISKYNLSI